MGRAERSTQGKVDLVSARSPHPALKPALQRLTTVADGGRIHAGWRQAITESITPRLVQRRLHEVRRPLGHAACFASPPTASPVRELAVPTQRRSWCLLARMTGPLREQPDTSPILKWDSDAAGARRSFAVRRRRCHGVDVMHSETISCTTTAACRRQRCSSWVGQIGDEARRLTEDPESAGDESAEASGRRGFSAPAQSGKDRRNRHACRLPRC